MSADEIIKGLKKLTAIQRGKVLRELLLLRRNTRSIPRTSSITLLAGKGANALKNIDVDSFLKKLRSEWD